MKDRVVLAYSGGLDTSVAIGWIAEVTGAEVIAVAADVGQGGEQGRAEPGHHRGQAHRLQRVGIETGRRGSTLGALTTLGRDLVGRRIEDEGALPLGTRTVIDLHVEEAGGQIVYGFEVTAIERESGRFVMRGPDGTSAFAPWASAAGKPTSSTPWPAPDSISAVRKRPWRSSALSAASARQ